ncbi:hypothetical protein JTB14_027563 [Gonioctena quinquepunctata]|nr:hypothetical protein JTB14_027563 [Gonioctena quinquepunctata]
MLLPTEPRGAQDTEESDVRENGDVYNSMDRHEQIDAVFTDVSKVFDEVHHETLKVELGELGVHGDLLSIIIS